MRLNLQLREMKEFLERLKNSKTEEQNDVTKVLAKAQRTLTGVQLHSGHKYTLKITAPRLMADMWGKLLM